MHVEGRTVKSPGAGRGFLLSLDGITIYNLWKVVIANCENESYNRLKGPSIPAFMYILYVSNVHVSSFPTFKRSGHLILQHSDRYPPRR